MSAGAAGRAADAAAANAWLRAMPAVFVLIWSTGFVVARLGMPHAPPMGFLAWRYAASIVGFGVWVALARGVAWPRDARQFAHLAVLGTLQHGGYLGGVWAAVKLGMPAGLAALIVCLQPVLTAAWLSWRSSTHRVSARQWFGLWLGLAGLTLVLWRRLHGGELGVAALALAIGALLSITVGTLYQKRFVAPLDVRSANLVQLLAALAVTLPLALLEHEPMHWNLALGAALVWSVFGLTLGGSSLLYLLIQRGAATEVTSLFYLVPPCTALMAWVGFGEAITPSMWLGMALCAAAVLLVRRG
ncbi:MAG: DMT family transporter [Ideonella sp.]|nr:DMT family transporter [Ideonella sp.]MCC7457018.1 DMT family transporter [Nitrospira sp.]